MDNITNKIVENYRDVTSVLNEKQIQTNSDQEGSKLTQDEEKTIKNVLIGKGLMIMYKRYKESAKVKKGNITETSSSNQSRKRKNATKPPSSSKTKKQRSIYDAMGIKDKTKNSNPQKTIPTLFSKQQQEQEQQKQQTRYNTRARRRGGKKSKRRTLKKKYKK